MSIIGDNRGAAVSTSDRMRRWLDELRSIRVELAFDGRNRFDILLEDMREAWLAELARELKNEESTR